MANGEGDVRRRVRGVCRSAAGGRAAHFGLDTLSPYTRVLLIGGTSHVGKTTLGREIASTLGWRHLSTDQLARHPGRPWRDDGSRVPDDVVAYYADGTLDEMLDSVVAHYEQNVWPIADALVRSHLHNAFDPGLVLEGSAILPEQVRASRFEHVAAVWLTASNDRIAERIAESSRFDRRTREEKALIEAFIARAAAFNDLVVDSARRAGEECLDVGDPEAFATLASRLDVLP